MKNEYINSFKDSVISHVKFIKNHLFRTSCMVLVLVAFSSLRAFSEVTDEDKMRASYNRYVPNSLELAQTDLSCLAFLNPFLPLKKIWNEARFHYLSEDELGNEITLSGYMLWPSLEKCDVILYCPYTHTSSKECATETNFLSDFDFSNNMEKLTLLSNWLIIPDGEGFGVDSVNHTQIYLNHEVWAKHMTDCLKAAWEIRNTLETERKPFNELYKIHLKKDWSMVITGTSQGGGTALATMRYMENVPSYISDQNLDDLFGLEFANVCCGPYDPESTMKEYLTMGLSYPCVVPMVIQSMINSFPDIMTYTEGEKKGQRISEDDFYTDSYIKNVKKDINNALMVEEMDYVGEKQQKYKKKGKNIVNLNDINKIFFDYYSKNIIEDGYEGYSDKNPMPMDSIINEATLNAFNDPGNASDAARQLLVCLKRNNVLFGEWKIDEGPWKPKANHYIKYYYNPNDNVVPYKNSEILRDFIVSERIKNYSEDISKSIPYSFLRFVGENPHVSACGAWVTTSWTDEGNTSLQALISQTTTIPYVRSIDSGHSFRLSFMNNSLFKYENTVSVLFFQDGNKRCSFTSKLFEVESKYSSNVSIECGDLSPLTTGSVNAYFVENKDETYLYSPDQLMLSKTFDYYNVDLTGNAPSSLSPTYSKGEDIVIKVKVSNNTDRKWTGPVTAIFKQTTKEEEKEESIEESVPKTITLISYNNTDIEFTIPASKFENGICSVTFTFGNHDDPLFTSVEPNSAVPYFNEVKHTVTICESQKCGDNLSWIFDYNTHVLTIDGTGPMTVYSSAEEVPWYAYRDYISHVVINEGVTSISNHAFEGCTHLYDITSYTQTAPVTYDDTFAGIRDDEACLLHAPEGSDYSSWMLPAEWCITSLKSDEDGYSWKFNKQSGHLSIICTGGKGVRMNDYFSSSLPWKVYADKILEVSIADGISYIGGNAFYGLSNLKAVILPTSPYTIGRGAFAKCSSLESVSLHYCESIGDNAFYDCASLESISIDKVDGEVGHADTSFRSVAPEGTLYVHQDMSETYQAWIGSVLPEGWEINNQMCTVTFEVFSHGTATLDGSADFERTVLRGSWVRIKSQPDAGFAMVVVANNEDVTSKLKEDRWQINENTHIIVKFWDLTMHAEFIDRIDPITGEPVKDIVSEDEAFDMDNGNTVMDVITSCIADKVKEEAGSAAVGAIGAAVGLVVGGPGGAKVGWDFGYYVAGWAATILEIVKTAFEDCENMTFASKAPQVRSRSIENGSAMEITRSNDFSNMSFIEDFHDKAVIAKDEILALNGLFAEYFGAENWLELVPIEELAKIISAVEEMKDDVISVETLMPYKPQNITDEELAIFAARINNTRSRAAGLRVASNNYIHASQMNQCSQTIAEAEEASKALGYEDTDEMWQTEFTQFYNRIEEQSKSVCATITLQFTQKLVMTRQAFRGTLTVFNGHEESPMRDVRLNLVVSDKQGHVATSHEFQINGQSLKGFAGEVDLGSGWTLDAQATGEATILFIPTKYAAPTEPVEYSFGGTLTYIDPFTDLEVTRDLYPVTLTVKPSPNLDLTYFMQRDILGDNALTTDVVEPMVPAEFALLIHNDGYGDATDVRMTTEQPKIVENEKGLLIDFELLSSQVNGKDKVMALGGSVPADFGTIPAHSTAYAQWMLQASLLGHFTDYNVEATHVTSYGNEDLSLLNEVTIHELIHSLSLTDVDGEPLVGWLVNDVTDANDEPDMLYFSNAETTSVNMLSEEQMNTSAVDNDHVSVTLSVGVAQAGWYYGCLVDPMAGRARITAVTRQSDGASIDPQNFWLTEYTLVDGKDPIQEYMLHFADTLSTTSETYTIAFEMLPEEMLSVTEFILPDKGDSSIYPDYVTTVGITFSKAIDPATFTVDDLKLTCRGKTIDLSGVTLSTEDNITFTMNLTGLTTEDGYYVLTVQTADITDATGYNGQAGKSVDWTQFYGGLLVLRAESQPAEGGSVSYEETAQKAALRRANENGDAQNESVLEVKVPYNSDGALTAQSAEGFGFGGWYMNDQLLSTESRYTSIFIDHTNLTAQFKQLYFDLTVDWNAKRGTVTGAGTGKYSYGSNLSLVATPFEGYRFYQWEVNDEVPDDNPGSAYTHTVTGDATLSPLFLAETSSGLLLGDVKEDGNINVGDYTALVSLIVGTDGGRYLLETADHNGNKKADVGDLATEVNMIMDIGSFAANSLRHMGDNGVVQSEFDPDNRLYGPEMTVKAGDEISVPLFLANKDEVSAFQTDIVLPDGLTLLDVAVAEERTTKLDHNLLVTSSKNGGTIRLLAGSSSNVSYRGAAGAVVMLRLRADEDMEDGEYIYQLKHIVLSSADSQIFHAPDCSMPMRIGNATGILTVSPQAESAKGIYDVAGRKIANEATIDVVNRLPAGVYVVSGRKIVVR